MKQFKRKKVYDGSQAQRVLVSLVLDPVTFSQKAQYLTAESRYRSQAAHLGAVWQQKGGERKGWSLISSLRVHFSDLPFFH